MDIQPITEEQFQHFKKMIFDVAGISLADSKKPLVSGRLAKRLRYHSLSNYGDYIHYLKTGSDPEEMQMAIDLLTTNETYFFREPKHFEFMRQQVLPKFTGGRPFRVWSAASSTGQEPYSIGMTLEDGLNGKSWDIVASDLSTKVLNIATTGHYPMDQAQHISKQYLHKYCLKGVDEYDGTFLVNRHIRSRIHFQQINLNHRLPDIGQFDLVFLRNVMIYFNNDTKRQVVLRIMEKMRNGAYLFIGHSESLNNIVDELTPVKPSIYQKS